VPSRKISRKRFFLETAQSGDESVLERRFVNADFFKRNVSIAESLRNDLFGFFWFTCQQIEPIAKALYVENLVFWSTQLGDHFLRFAYL